MKLKLLGLAVVMFAGLSAAQTQNSTASVDPGLVKAGGLAYGFDVAFDNALATAGFVSPGEVAKERASEVSVASDRNNTDAVEKALEKYGSVVADANNDDKDSLEQAESVLTNVGSRVPEEAEFGIQTALNVTQQAKQRIPDKFTAPSDDPSNGSGFMPDVSLPGGPEDDLEVPGGR